MQANIPFAANFINTCLESQPRDCGGFAYPYVRSPNDCTYNMKGRVEFRVRKELWPKRDTQKVALEKLRRTLGEPTSSGAHASTQAYVWNFGNGRTLTLKWVYGQGTFLQLQDTEAK